MEELILVLDAGTGGGRAVAVDRRGRVRARSYAAWGYFEPEGVEFYGREFRPEEFQRLLAECCRRVVAEVGAEAVKGVTTTAMRQGCVFLDAEGVPLYGGPNRDVRGMLFTDEVEALLREERTYALSGRWPPWMFVPCRYYWFKKKRPRLAERITKILMINDWLIYWLCGRAAGEPTNAAETMLFDVTRRRWSEELLGVMELRPEQMAEVLACGTLAGEVSAPAGRETGLLPGTPVITGMADTPAALLAGAVTEPGEAGIVAGSTAPVMIVMNEPRLDPEKRVWINCHPLPGRWLAESNAGDAGLVYRWWVEGHLAAVGVEPAEAYTAAERWAAEIGPGANGARAFLGPLIWDLGRMTPAARAGVFFPYPISAENAGPGNVARAVLENIAFAVRANLEQAAAVAGNPRRVVISGGMTRSEVFQRIVAGVLGREVEVVAEAEATAVGCAMAGFSAIRLYPDLGTAAQEMKGEPRRIAAADDERDEYDDLYEQWREEYDRMMGLAEE